MINRKNTLSLMIAAFTFTLVNVVFAQDAPSGTKVFPGGYNNLDFLYVFGPKGRQRSGREDSLQIVFYRVPLDAGDNVSLYVYDPGSGGVFDKQRLQFGRKTHTKFTVFGGPGAYSDAASQSVTPSPIQPGTELDSQTFSDDYADQWVEFGPFSAEQGEVIGKYAYFKLVVEAIKGSKVNNFKTAIKPKAADAFTYSITVRLNEVRGSTMAFAVEVPENTSSIVEYNFDIDKGGIPYLETPTARYELYPSGSGQWIANDVALDAPTSSTQNFRYEIVKGSQGHANCGFYFTDDADRPLRIFFEGEIPTAAPAPVATRTDYETVSKTTPSVSYTEAPGTTSDYKPPSYPTPASSKPAAKPTITSVGDQNQCEASTNFMHIYKLVPAETSLGETYTMKMVVTALVDIAEIEINDILDDGVSFIQSDPPAKQVGRELSWALEKMKSGESQEIIVTLKADKEGELFSCATFAAIPYGCLTTTVGQAVLAIEKVGPEQASLDDQVTYTIAVRNTGTAIAKNVVITDDVPSGLTHSSGNSTLSFNVGDLAPNESRQESVTFTTTERGKVCNPAVATSDNADRVSDQACTVIVEPKLEIVKTGPKEQYLGKVAKYKIKVSNPGDVTLTDVNLTDIAPSETRIIKAKNGNVSGNRASWIVPQIAAGETLDFDIALTSEIPGNHCNDAAVRVAEGLSGESTACTVWKGYPALLLEVIDTVDPLQVDIGEMTTYQIRVTNQGTAVDNNIGIVMRFPAEISAVSASGATSASVEAKTVKFAVYPQLAPKEVIEFIIEAKAEQIGDARLEVQLTSESLKSPVKEEESTHVY